MKIPDETTRNFYVKECAESAWSVQQLERQIHIDEILQLEDGDEEWIGRFYKDNDPLYWQGSYSGAGVLFCSLKSARSFI